uniref:Uncharacterized protein n=1 Tax=Anguilla anguilla TaxID=7936 RepID=A0A0E9ULG8_ANGAN
MTFKTDVIKDAMQFSDRVGQPAPCPGQN